MQPLYGKIWRNNKLFKIHFIYSRVSKLMGSEIVMNIHFIKANFRSWEHFDKYSNINIEIY